MTQSETPILLLTGYLGSGKTTLLNHILHNKKGIKFAVIVNDLGEINIDADLIRKGGIVGADETSDDLVALQNGCICCTLQNDLIKQISDLIMTHNFDYIVIEASGICEPAPIARTIDAMNRMGAPVPESRPRLDCIVTVVDALRMKAEFENGDSLRRPNLDEDDIENLIIEQIEFCNIIILNKISEVTTEDAAKLKAIIRALQPKARIIESDYANIDIEEIINTNLFDFEKVATSATWVDQIENHHPDEDDHDEHEHHHHHHDDDEHEHHHHDHDHHHHHHHDGEGEAEEYGIGTMVYYNRRPFNFEKFDRMVNLHWPKNIIRAKGVVYFSQNRDMSILFEQAGTQKKITEAGYWFATAPEAELKQMMKNDANLRRDWDEKYGDRMEKIVLIGRDLDRQKLYELFDSCLEKE
ncbi:MAG: GTP-binding protein [Muribaculaceae bacterium]|nr:GTP-binding protein [Muribaculaceae bacterium]MDE6644002.1 GTP-binding protein [Muribaculaceae bacterium]